MNSGIADKVSENGIHFIFCFVWLSHDALTRQALQFRLLPKLHVLQHESWKVKEWRLNLKTLSCFSDEDFVGKVCAMAQSSHHSGTLKNLVFRILAASFACWGGASTS
jgi:hypothetical protein